jgi:hypothetical protein
MPVVHPATLDFVVPVRHQASVADWAGVKRTLATTLSSTAAQTRSTWRAVVVANRGADVPTLPNGVTLVEVDFPKPDMPDPKADLEAFYDGIRADKGRRVLAGLLEIRPSGFVMVVDYDDLVSNRLAEFVAGHAGANGWYFDTGYLFSDERLIYRRPREFHEVCGTSLIVRGDLLNVPERFEDASEIYIRRTLGSHKFIKNALAERGTPLAALPFTGAAYRIGHGGSSTSSSGLFEHLFPKKDLLRRPAHVAVRATRLRPIGTKIRDEFFGAAS